MKNKRLKGYICGTDTIDLYLGAVDVVIYPSIKSLKARISCWKECGILEIDLTNLKVIKKSKF